MAFFYIKRKKVNQINIMNIQYIHLSEKYLIYMKKQLFEIFCFLILSDNSLFL
jgi:hypothetical protein